MIPIALDFVTFASESLDDALGGYAFLHHGGEIGQLRLDFRAGILDHLAEHAHGHGDHRHGDQGHQSQLPVQQEHHHQGADENRALGHDVDDPVRQRALHRRHVVCQVAHDFAGLVAVEIGNGQPLEFREKLVADVEDDALADVGDQIALPEVEKAADKEDHEHADADQVQRFHVLLGQHLVDHVLDDPGHVKVRCRRDDHADDGLRDPQSVRLQVLQQPKILFHRFVFFLSY